MRKNTLVIRAIFAIIILALFGFLAVYLYQRQKLELNFLSFKVPNATNSFIIPDVDRMVDKIGSVEELKMSDWPVQLREGMNRVLQEDRFSFNREISKSCFVSFNSTEFTVVFETTSSMSTLTEVIAAEFQTKATSSGDQLTIGQATLNMKRFGNYLAISNGDIDPERKPNKLIYGNADYVVFDQGDSLPTRHILSKNFHFRLWEEPDAAILGRPVQHEVYFNAAPAVFDELVFYGSSRVGEDATSFFNSPSEDSFSWLLDGLIYIRKDSMEIVLGQQGDSRDLRLMLEEQTLEQKTDSIAITHFNISDFKILSFRSNFQWENEIPELRQQLSYYTEFMNFNVLTNSIPAMRWYLRQVQLGNLLENNDQVKQTYNDCLPAMAHFVKMGRDSSQNFVCESKIYQKDSLCLNSFVSSSAVQSSDQSIEVVYDFTADIVPDKLTAVHQKGETFLLLNNQKQLAHYAVSGEQQWRLDLSTPLVEDPQVVDFDNDGIFEYVLFQNNQIDVVNNKGKSLNGFPVMLGGTSAAGLAVNYDNKYKYRLIVNVDNTVKVYSEAGKIVEGWMFNGMQAVISSKIYHVITKGKDIITFKDKDNVQHVLNRRGEYRLEQEVKFNLSNETDFVVGSLESALRKMGYANNYIYNYYILDGMKDSVKIDQTVTPVATYWEYNEGKPLLIIEEPGRLLIVNQFGYVQSEVLKPNQSNEFVGLVGQKDFGFVFADNAQNNIYLLNNYGKMILPQAIEGSAVSIIDEQLLYSFSGISIKAYKIAL